MLCLCLSGNIRASRLSEAMLAISNYILSPAFSEIHRDDLVRVDSIYANALRICGNDKSEAMLSLAVIFSPVSKIKLFGLSVAIPTVGDSIYRAVSERTPSMLFSDSPKNLFGDRDKLAHFFGSAFLRYSKNLINISYYTGILVELFEDGMNLPGGLDQRDLAADLLGIKFAEETRDNERTMPSSSMKGTALKKINPFN